MPPLPPFSPTKVAFCLPPVLPEADTPADTSILPQEERLTIDYEPVEMDAKAKDGHNLQEEGREKLVRKRYKFAKKGDHSNRANHQ